MDNTIIYLIGFAGTGKLTIAREIATLTNIRVVDNHLINNLVFSLIKLDGSPISDSVWEKIWTIRHIVLDVIKDISAPELSFIFTNELIEGVGDDEKLFAEIAGLAAQRKSKFFPVRLLCSEKELCKRIISDDRKKSLKDMNAENAQRNCNNNVIFQPKTHQYLTLDVTNLSAYEAAQAIIEHTITKND